MRRQFLISFWSTYFTRIFLSTLKFKKIKVNNIYFKLHILFLLKTKSFEFNGSVKILPICSFGILPFKYVYLTKIKNLFFWKNSIIHNYFFFQIFNLFKNLYFLTDLQFNSLWLRNLAKYSFIFYRFFFFFVNIKTQISLNNFYITLFTRFKKTRRRFITLNRTDLDVGISRYYTSTNYTISSFLTSKLKLNRLISTYWFFLKNFFFLKPVKKATLKKTYFIIRNNFLSVYYITPFCRHFLAGEGKKLTFGFIINQPIYYGTFFLKFYTEGGLVKRLISHRRKIRRFIFKQFKITTFVLNDIRLKKIKLNSFFFLSRSLFYMITVYLYSLWNVFSVVLVGKYQTLILKCHRFLVKFNWRFTKKKKKTLRKRFFSFKRLKRHRIHRLFKRFRFKKEVFRVKTLIHSKLPNFYNFNNIVFLNKTLLSTLSTKVVLILSMLLLTKFRRFLPQILTIFRLFYNHRVRLYFLKYINKFKKWSNIIPFFYLPKQVKLLVKSKKSQLSHDEYLIYLRQIMGGFLESLCQKKIFLKISTKLRIKTKTKKILLFLYKRHRNYQNTIGRGFFFNEMLFVCWYAMFTKDLQFLLGWLVRAMCRMEIRKHRKFIKIIKVLFTKYKSFFLKLNKVKGIKLDVRGKLGVKGNAKKRHLSFNVNTTSFSKKKYRLDYRQGLVYTETGVLGVTLIITY